MQTVFEAAGGNDGLRRLADAWHRRVMADDEVAHAFSHGFHPQHVERLAAYWAEALVGPTTSPGRPRQQCPATTSPPMMCRTASASHTGHGTDSKCKTPRLTTAIGPNFGPSD